MNRPIYEALLSVVILSTVAQAGPLGLPTASASFGLGTAYVISPLGALPSIPIGMPSLPSLGLPDFDLPSFDLPSLGLPSFGWPSWLGWPDMPDMPDIDMPDIDMPDIDIDLPDIDIDLPDIDVDLPDIGLPDLDLPSLPSMPSLGWPSWDIPFIDLPSFSSDEPKLPGGASLPGSLGEDMQTLKTLQRISKAVNTIRKMV